MYQTYLPGRTFHVYAAVTGGSSWPPGVMQNAGAWFDNSIRSPAALALDAPGFLTKNDAYNYFSELDQLVMTGPTLTNVNDFRAILIR